MLRAWGRLRHAISRMGFGFVRDKKEETAREYRSRQQIYIDKFVFDLRSRVNDGDEVSSILGNMMRTTSLKDEEILLASYTGSSSLTFISHIAG